MEDDTNENNYIRTRAHLYTLEQEQMNQHKEKKPTSGAKNTRNKHILNCRKHYKQKPEPQPQCNDCIRYQYVNQLPHGYLPSCKTVLEYLLTSKSEQTGKRINHERAVGADLAMLWIYFALNFLFFKITTNMCVKKTFLALFSTYSLYSFQNIFKKKYLSVLIINIIK